MFKKGDKVTVVNGDMIDGSEMNYLTTGKVYEVAVDQTYDTNVNVINDQGRSQGYFPQRFKLHEEPVPALNLSKPLETISGEPFVLLSKEGRGAFNIVGYVGDRDYVMKFNGKGEPSCNHPAFKLRNVEEKPLEKEVYFNVYKRGGELHAGASWSSRARADEEANDDRVGCAKVKLVEGQFDE
jgi:hypothetical protein